MTVALADVLWAAANKHLTTDEGGWARHADYFSCCAVMIALARRHQRTWLANDFLESLGCPIHTGTCFFDHEDGMARQGVRYMWLLLAMHVAEDENIYVEVS